MDKTITIGARYLREGIKRDYNDWIFSWAREVSQNSTDAGAKIVVSTVKLDDDGNTVVTWSDDGIGMDADTIENKFMALGESGKTDGVGGFGVAGALIAFAQLDYSIRTRDCLVKGKGSNYGIETGLSYHKGVALSVTMEGDKAELIRSAIRKWCRFSTVETAFWLNGVLLVTLRKHKPKAETEWCNVTTYRNIPEFEHEMHVRLNGQLMHSVYTSFNLHIVVEITGKSLDYLTSNRDGLKWQTRRKLDKLVQELYENPNKIKANDDTTTVWRGTDGLVKLEKDKPRKVSKISLSAPVMTGRVNKEVALAIASTPQQLKPLYVPKTITEIQTLIDGHDVVIVNQTNKPVPAKWIPGYMNKHAYKLINRWIRVVQACGGIMGMTEEVSIGFCFSHEARAIHKYTREFGHMILINPVEVGETKFTNYFSNSNASFYELVSIAVHELCHIGYDSHKNDWAVHYTQSIAKVMARPTLLKKIKSETKI